MINSYYHEYVTRQQGEELRRQADRDRMVRIAREAKRQRRVARLEARQLEAVVDGRTGLAFLLRGLRLGLLTGELTGGRHGQAELPAAATAPAAAQAPTVPAVPSGREVSTGADCNQA